ncbi:glucose-6-phosphate isomerase [Nitrosopumilus sp.]|nr:glucose-6-phosphate isomerase [Nitrosopumilus sp.]
MLTQEEMKIVDKSHLYQIYDNWPVMAKNSLNNNLKEIVTEKISHIVFAGMGGSGTIGDIFASVLSKTDIHVEVVKGYHLPKTVKQNSLLICTSVSGNTIETITVLKEGIELGCKIMAFSSGGEIKKICNERKIEHRKILMNHSPRASLVTYLYSMIKILLPILPISTKDINNSIEELKKTEEKVSSLNLNENNISLNLAYWIKNTPVIYYPWGLQSVAIRFKNSLQENTKLHVMIDDIIESCHNGIVSWEKDSTLQPILIEGEDDYIKTKERWAIIKEIFLEKDISFYEIKSNNGNILSKIIQLIYILDYCTIYLAILKNVDPTPVLSIDLIKRKLEKL